MRATVIQHLESAAGTTIFFLLTLRLSRAVVQPRLNRVLPPWWHRYTTGIGILLVSGVVVLAVCAIGMDQLGASLIAVRTSFCPQCAMVQR
jgi:hypothetical protein